MSHPALLQRNAALARTFDQVRRYAADWERANAAALAGHGPLWVVLGDSAALGVGATAYDRGYVGSVRRALGSGTGGPWRVVNLAVSGARTRDVLADQVPRLAGLPTPDLLSAVVGGNDLVRTPLRSWLADISRLCAVLPPRAVVGTVPRGFRERKARAANAYLAAEAERHGLALADVWACTGPPWRGKYVDGLHPSEVGYRDWTEAVLRALQRGSGRLREPSVCWQ